MPAVFDAATLYRDVYCARGEMENRIKEQQLDLFADRTSTALMQSNQLRLYWAKAQRPMAARQQSATASDRSSLYTL